jgi:hypothetical protein
MSNMDINAGGTIASHIPRKSFVQAASQIVLADVSMSLDNVLTVADAAQEHFTVQDRFSDLVSYTGSQHKSCTQTIINFVCCIPPLMKYQLSVAALVAGVYEIDADIGGRHVTSLSSKERRQSSKFPRAVNRHRSVHSDFGKRSGARQARSQQVSDSAI